MRLYSVHVTCQLIDCVMPSILFMLIHVFFLVLNQLIMYDMCFNVYMYMYMYIH